MPVALKVAQFAEDVRFVREVELLSRCRHPSIPRLIDHGTWRAGTGAIHPFVVMEWVDGLPLYKWEEVHRGTLRQVLRVVAQVAGALEVMHRNGCLHRDVKGDNILVGAEGRAWLMDYGSGTWAGAPPVTDSVMPPGTPEYRSPEASRFEWAHYRDKEARYEARPADDLYSLGLTAYRLVTRVYPPPGTDPQVLKDSLQAPSPARVPAQELNARVPPELSALIERMLAKEPEARAQAHEVAESAESAATRVGAEVDAPLSDAEPMAAGAEAVRAGAVPWPGLERPPLEPASMPRREVPLASDKGSASKAQVVPARARTGRRVAPWQWRTGVGAAAAGLLLVGVGWTLAVWQRAGAEVTPKEARDAAVAGLGEVTRKAPEAARDEPRASPAIAAEMPEEPQPNQRRAPCTRSGEVEIRGGCWGRSKEDPPCAEVSYEWQRACYFPVLERTRKPTSGQPR